MRIFARDTVVKSIDKELAIDFVNLHHRQGMPSRCHITHCYALYSKKDLKLDYPLGVIVFSVPRTKLKQRLYKYELLRCCFNGNIRVVGGVSKLIKHFIREVNPVDFFSYQDLSGEITKVYELSGMSLVSKGDSKNVLVKNGKTFATAENNRKDWFSMQQASTIGADRLLKLSLGEVFNEETGKRLTNVEIFTELLDYHIETVPGENLYEWRSSDYIFYTYKITASDSDKYYFGRKTVPLNGGVKPSAEELLQDGYFGSGGVKFKNWKNRHKDFLVKEVIGVFDTWAESVKHECDLIGDKYKIDPLCLNSVPGGVGLTGATVENRTMLMNCKIHGMVKHSANKVCFSCALGKAYRDSECDKHGLTSHKNGVCCKCTYEDSITIKFCETHGNVEHISKGCIKCLIGTRDGNCEIHGKTRLSKNGSCFRCVGMSNKIKHGFVDKECKVHGITPFAKDTCIKCSVSGAYSQGSCLMHGEGVSFKNGRCTACVNIKKFSVDYRDCSSHGKESLFVDNVCLKCFMDSNEDFKVMFDSASVAPKHNYFYVCSRCGKDKITIKPGDFAHDSIALVDKQGKLPDFWQRNFCFDCEKAFSFWDKTIELRKLRTFIVDLGLVVPPVVNKKDSRKLQMRCCSCNYDFVDSVRAAVRRLEGSGIVCKNCKQNLQHAEV